MMIAILLCKIIGILLLVLLVLLLLLLFCPISYNVDADADQRTVTAYGHWLFRLLRYSFSYEEKATLFLYVFFVKIDLLDEEKRKKRKAKKEAKNKKKKKPEKEKPPVSTRIKMAVSKAKAILSLSYQHSLPDTIFPGLQMFLCNIAPRRLSGQVSFGFDDPSTTAKVAGCLALLPFLYTSRLHITPDFETEQTFVSGTVCVSGKLRIVAIVKMLLRWLAQKDFRDFLAAYRKIGKK